MSTKTVVKTEKFTPGPWKVEVINHHKEFCYRLLNNNHNLEFQEAIANAALQEAAPDMYEALKDAYDLLYPLINNPASGKLMDKIITALDKANPNK